jgi:hypothetical protein
MYACIYFLDFIYLRNTIFLRRTWTFPTFSKRPSTSPYWLPIQVQLCLGSENSTYKSLRGDRTDHDWSDQINICMKIFSVAQLRVNDTVGHTTCSVYALKSHILQTRLTGYTTCETCALEVTNPSVVRFFVKTTHHTLSMVGLFFAFNSLAKNYVVQFHLSNFLQG